MEQISPLVKIQKEKKLQEIRNFIENTADGLGKGLDKGMIEPCIYLNALGFITRQSCDGHGEFPPWVDFLTEAEKHERDLEEINQSPYREVVNYAHEIADQKTKEFFGEEFETWKNNPRIRNTEVADFWFKEDRIARENHPNYPAWQKYVDDTTKERDLLHTKLNDLKNEFLDSISEPTSKMFVDRSRMCFNPEFIQEENYDEIVKTGSDLLKKFESFLKNKYLNS
jgi:hypothetical protein